MYQKHTSAHVMSESQTPAQDQRCQSGPSVRKIIRPCWGRFFKELWGQDQQTTTDFRSSFWQIHHTSTIRLLQDEIQDRGMYLLTIFLRELCCGSKKWSWLIQWMIQKTWCSLRGIQMPKFEVFDTKIASASNRIIHNSHSKKKGPVWRSKKS